MIVAQKGALAAASSNGANIKEQRVKGRSEFQDMLDSRQETEAEHEARLESARLDRLKGVDRTRSVLESTETLIIDGSGSSGGAGKGADALKVFQKEAGGGGGFGPSQLCLARGMDALGARATAVTESGPFQGAVILAIFVAGVNVGLSTYPQLDGNATIGAVDSLVLLLFVVECVLKIAAQGRRPWMYW